MNANEPSTTAPAPKISGKVITCKCQCGQRTNRGRTFRPGHDARMVSLITQDVTNGDLKYTNEVLPDTATFEAEGHRMDQQDLIDTVTRGIRARFSEALADKAWNAMMNAWAKTAKDDERATKANRKPQERKYTPMVHQSLKPVKVGRWEYPARLGTDGNTVERNTKRDGSGEWIPVN